MMLRQDDEREHKLETHDGKEPEIKLRSEYLKPEFLIDTVKLEFHLEDDRTIVTSLVAFRRNGNHNKSLILDGGKALVLSSVSVDGAELTGDAYERRDESLTLFDVPDSFELSIVTHIQPDKNTTLEGLYKSSGNYCTQCEAEGFRHITYYLDRPDVMASFEVLIVADKDQNPVLLSNGNLVEEGELGDGKHFARWIDPWPKPSYLFALVAGNLACLSDQYVTKSGKQVALNIYAVEKDIPKCEFAMQSLIQSMKWDEQTFGLEYDLDVYNIVAVGDFNMGAMENKGLNVFNTKYVLADSQSATDTDYDHIQGVIGHEYFHNWTGNRVTCRDWFQLSLKEGLTVFRDQEFSSDLGSRAVKRIDDVRVLRSFQFPEDSGPLAHPIRPEKYIEINNFYTATVYNKGAEVIRMMHNIIGVDNFRRGMDLYFERHDGQAVTCEDFVAAMETASGVDLQQFRLWYSQAGTPTVLASGVYDAANMTYSLTLKQSCLPTAEQPEKQPYHMPIITGLLGGNGGDLNVQPPEGSVKYPSGIMLNFREAEQTFVFECVSERPVVSLLRGFSAPVILETSFSREDESFLFASDNDAFSRWEAGQTIARDSILKAVEVSSEGGLYATPQNVVEAFGSVTKDSSSDPALIAELLSLPGEGYLGQFMKTVDVDGIHKARSDLKAQIAKEHYASFLEVYHRSGGFQGNGQEAKALRRLKNIALSYLVASGSDEANTFMEQQYKTANNMTDKLAALSELCHSDLEFRQEALSDFYDTWKGNDLVIDKWFTVQAISERDNALTDVITLCEHPDFTLKNPNRLRALVGAFSMNNQVRFHEKTGRGYEFLSSIVQKVDGLNPQVAARMVSPLGQWRKFDKNRQILMKSELSKLANADKFSPNVYELAHRSLEC